MPLPEIGKLYIPTADEWRDGMLADIRLELLKQDQTSNPPVQPGTDNYRWATALSGPCALNCANVAIHAEAGDPRTATGDQLDEIRSALGLPEVPATGSSGKIKLTVTGSSTVPANTQLTLANGKRLKVTTTAVGVTDGSEIDVTAVDAGEDTNAPPNTLVRFVNAPLNVDTQARVSVNVPLTGGTDKENDARKRTRVLNRLQNPPAGGNWPQKRETALNSLASVQDCFVYPALGGPSSELIVPVKDFDPDNFDFSRALSTSAMAVVRAAIHAAFPSPSEIVVKPPVNQSVDVALEVSIPDSSSAGGDGTGWTDATVWPQLEVADAGRVSVSSVTSTTVIVVSANTATAPTANVTHIAWWSPTCRKFYKRLITAQSGSAGAWTLTVDAPLIDDAGVSVAAGDYISPDSVGIIRYGKTWIDIMRTLGPGEGTADANRLPRSKRHPYATSDASLAPDLKTSKLALFKENHSEVLDYGYGYRSATTATVPGAVSTAPSILVPRHFGIYKQ